MLAKFRSDFSKPEANRKGNRRANRQSQEKNICDCRKTGVRCKRGGVKRSFFRIRITFLKIMKKWTGAEWTFSENGNDFDPPETAWRERTPPFSRTRLSTFETHLRRLQPQSDPLNRPYKNRCFMNPKETFATRLGTLGVARCFSLCCSCQRKGRVFI